MLSLNNIGYINPQALSTLRGKNPQNHIIQLLPFCEGNMTICSPETGNVSITLTVDGVHIVTLPSYKDNNCFIIQNSYNFNCTDINDVTAWNVLTEVTFEGNITCVILCISPRELLLLFVAPLISIYYNKIWQLDEGNVLLNHLTIDKLMVYTSQYLYQTTCCWVSLYHLAFCKFKTIWEWYWMN